MIPCATLIALCALFGWARGAQDEIPPGTNITMQNWQRYRQFMPDGMIELFKGQYAWKMPADVEMQVGPTIIHPLPKGYVEATEKHAPLTKLVSLPNGGHTIANYVAGRPFPNPGEPSKGWKILANMWYRYIPHIIAATPVNLIRYCTQDRFGNIACSTSQSVYRQLKHNTDPGVPMDDPAAADKDYTEWTMLETPEQVKYTAHLTIFYTDLTRLEDTYEFTPSLRRPVELSASARCIPSGGGDFTQDDLRYGFNGNITQFDAKFLGDRKVLALTDYQPLQGGFPDHYYMPLGFPKPDWGKWEVRDVDVIDVRKVPSEAKGYCYGKRVMYIDKQMNAPLWEDLYDAEMKLWKVALFCPLAKEVPGVGVQNVNGTALQHVWDLRNQHASYFSSIGNGQGFLVNEQVPKEFQDVARYSTPGGLNQIMR